jgi:TonB family protein
MSPEPRSVSEASPKESLGSLTGCLVDGDAEQLARQRRVKRRALVISILLQSAVLAALILLPLFSKAERISLNIVTPTVPYGHHNNHQRANTRTTTSHAIIPDRGFTFHPPTNNAKQHPVEDPEPGGPIVEYDPNDRNVGPDCPGCVDIGIRESGPRPPQPVIDAPSKPAMIRMTTIDPAMLRHRVEPVYPKLAQQIHKEGRVELRAIIGTDGTIRSLQIVSGDPLFYISAREAVEQWLYKPTYLNGQAVEIDTFITVVYVMQH